MDSAPEIYPVNFVVDAQTVVFRTDAGTKLQAIEVTERAELDRLGSLPLSIWGIGEKAHRTRILVAEISGRCIRRGADDGLTSD